MSGSRNALLTLDAFDEPALIVGADGTIIEANRAADAWFGRRVAGLQLASLEAGPAIAAHRLVARSARTTASMVGALSLLGASGEAERIRCYGKLLQPASEAGAGIVLLRFARDIDTRFRALTKQIQELNAEVKRHLQTQLLLQRTLSERELLLRELSHRVMNNMQMLSALLAGAQRETDDERAQQLLRSAGQRVSAMAAAQHALYRADELKSIDARRLVEAVSTQIRELAAVPVSIEIEADAVELDNNHAVPLALILNELLMNAVKHGAVTPDANIISVGLKRNGKDFQLRVEDCGPGFTLEDTSKRASGLGLVTGLVRQLGGSFRVERRAGACCIVQFGRG